MIRLQGSAVLRPALFFHAAAWLALLVAGPAVAQAPYPEKPIRLIIGFPSGAAPDTVSRLLGPHLANALGKPVLVDNVPGAAGNIASERLAKAAPDGHTLGLLVQGQLAINPVLHAVGFDPVRDFAPVSQVVAQANVLVVHNEVPAKSIRELVALAKSQPGTLTYASAGIGSTSHLAAEVLGHMAGIEMRHVPYKAVVAAIPDVGSGRVTMMFAPTSTVMPLVRQGKLRAIAVTTLKPAPAFPELPALAESGFPGYEVTNWYGLLAPARTPPAIVRRLHQETVKVLALPEVRTRLGELALDNIGSTPEEFATVIRSELPKWGKLIRDMGIKAE